MRKLVFMLPVIMMLSCLAENVENNENKKQDIELASNEQINEKLSSIFGEIDSTKIINSIGCIQGYFGHISPEYVLKISSKIYSQNESTQEYNFGQNGLQCELLVFEKDSSHLANICTDVLFVNYPEPKRTIKSIKGRMKVFNGNPRELWGEKVNNTYIEIRELEFVDSLDDNRKIIVKDKIFWEVPYLGVPG